VHRLLVAGLYHEARVKRQQGDSAEAARLTLELAREVPNDPTVKMLVIESTYRDRHDPHAALAQLDSLTVAPGDDRMTMRTGMLRSDILVAAGMKDSAKAVLGALAAKYPDRPFLADALKKLQ
jgi:predicted Zn-dependent protease